MGQFRLRDSRRTKDLDWLRHQKHARAFREFEELVDPSLRIPVSGFRIPGFRVALRFLNEYIRAVYGAFHVL